MNRSVFILFFASIICVETAFARTELAESASLTQIDSKLPSATENFQSISQCIHQNLKDPFDKCREMAKVNDDKFAELVSDQIVVEELKKFKVAGLEIDSARERLKLIGVCVADMGLMGRMPLRPVQLRLYCADTVDRRMGLR